MAGNIPSAVRRARLALIEAGDLLCSPRPAQFDRCETALKAAAWELAAFRADVGDAGSCPEALAEARSLKTALERARRLLESAADHHRRWSRALGSLVGGYTARGEAAAVARPGRMLLQG
jgi:hypothetical protein